MKIQEAQTVKEFKWQVIFLLLFFSLYQSVSAQIHYSIFEEMQKGSLIGNLGKDLGLNIKDISVRKFRVVSQFSEKYFSVNLLNGNLNVANRIDRETLCGTAEECFLTFDAVIENPLNIYHVRVDIKDINDNPPRFVHETIELKISEHTLPGVRFALQSAEDLDVGINSLQSYKLNKNKHFALAEEAGTDSSIKPKLILEVPLDREVESIHEIVLTAFDGGNPVQSGTTLIIITVTDLNDNFPQFVQDVYKVSINENIPLNSTILHVSASQSKQAIKTFYIYSISGEIKVKENLDYEKTKYYEISVEAKDGGDLVSQAKVLIEILDENDNVPEISVTSITNPVCEDSAPGTVVALINIQDLDSGENGEFDCKAVGAVPFKLLLSSGNFYKIVTTSSLDREKDSYYNITIEATDHGSPPLSLRKSIRLDISDNNNQEPPIYSIQALDKDTGENAKLKQLIMVLHHYETDREFQIQVIAKDHGSPSLNSSTILRICIIDQNDNLPIILYPSPDADAGGSAGYEMVSFSSDQGSLVTKVIAVDADSGHNAWLSYYFSQDSDTSHFIIDQYTGEVRTARVFQEKDVLRHRVVVIVKDNGTPPLTASVTVNLVVADNFQNVPPELTHQTRKLDPQSNMHIYLVIAVAVISFLFLLTVILVIICKYRIIV
ncbi:hypothetical protein GDO86_005297 [Hymenochirus boettgeri]|uniref:Cadherin domain-containing protein n=1 Tax=Hymenochirus boettgeri TaxID=247094 RepID=A0A8T2J6F9_9PIPI|nr:hypothetical protein GDO86_005297 [Hymenochirus boettgeri]